MSYVVTYWSHNMKPFGELEREEQIALFEAWLDGKEIEFYNPHVDTWFSGDPNWTKGLSYRIKPTQPSINWDHVHPDYIALTEEESGEPHLHKVKPVNTSRYGWHSSSKAIARTHASYKAGTCNWQDSLVMRPKV